MANNENIIQKKSYEFALKIINAYKDLRFNKQEYVLSKQILRSGTSIGANIEEGIGGQSKKDFIAKFQVALKETRETHYWLRLLLDSDTINIQTGKSLIHDCEELIKILTSILKTSKSNVQ